MSKNIHEAILAIMKDVEYVEKDGKIKHGGNYRFASEGAFIRALRPSMVKHGVYIYPSGVTDVQFSTYKTSGDKEMNMADGVHEFSFVHAASDTSIVVVVRGMGADIGDKAANKSMTAALKYALRQTFLIETGDDPDQTPSELQVREPLEDKAWDPAQVEKVIEFTYIDKPESAQAFLDSSGLVKSAALLAVERFARAFQGAIDSDLDKQEALEFARQNWRGEG